MTRKLKQFRDIQSIDRLCVRIEDLQMRITSLRQRRAKLIDLEKKRKRRATDPDYREREQSRVRMAMRVKRQRAEDWPYHGRSYG